MSILSRTKPRSWTGCRPLSNDERRAAWASTFYGAGHQRRGTPAQETANQNAIANLTDMATRRVALLKPKPMSAAGLDRVASHMKALFDAG